MTELTDPLPRDKDGYVDLDAIADDAVGLDLAAIAPVPPLPEDVWDAIVSAAPHVDADAAGIDADTLTTATVPPRDEPSDAGALDAQDAPSAPVGEITTGADEPAWAAEGADPAIDGGVSDDAAGDVPPWDHT